MDIYTEIEELKQTVALLQSQQEYKDKLLDHHDKILVRGNGVPSLQETVRNLNTMMQNFILDVQTERHKREEREEQERRRKLDEATKLKWTLIGVGLPLLVSFIGQAIIFWVKVAPLISKLVEE